MVLQTSCKSFPEKPLKPVLRVRGLSKTYRLFRKPIDRLWQFLLPRQQIVGRTFIALQDVDFDLKPGEVLGIVGVNGAGKSTLLQLVSKTIKPSSGEVELNGRVAAILELGAGFNPEFTGMENIYLNASTIGLSRSEVEKRLPGILEFAGIGEHINDPVKTYSSGMQIRLAFSIATSTDADLLIIDEALSVGDGAFRRKSFDRIMQIREQGTAILFCSHVLYHLEALCERALWLHQGKVQALGPCKEVLRDYQDFLDRSLDSSTEATQTKSELVDTKKDNDGFRDPSFQRLSPQGESRIEEVLIKINGSEELEQTIYTEQSQLAIEVYFISDPSLPTPSAAIVISTESGRILGSNISASNNIVFSRDESGRGVARFHTDRLPFTSGRYRIGAYLFCERGLHGYDMRDPCATIELRHRGLEVGFLKLNGGWDEH
jgi:lipopolysaccharide transport system ATP-binding protein